MLIESGLKRVQHRQAVLLAHGEGVFSAPTPGLQGTLGQRFDLIQAADHAQRLAGTAIGFALGLGRFIKIAARVDEASKMQYSTERAPGAVTVGHQRARKAAQECLRMLLPAPSLILEQHHRRGARFGAAPILVQHLDGSLVTMAERLSG